jgi:hypothetical protein
MIEWTVDQLVHTIRDEIAEYKELKTRLASATGDETERIRLQMFDKATTIIQVLKKELVEQRGRADLWEEFIEWERSLS